MSLPDLNAIPLNVEDNTGENPSLKVVDNRPSTSNPSSLAQNGYQLDVPELNSDADEVAMKDFEAAGGAAALLIEAFYNVGGISSRAPEWVKAAIEGQANYLQKTADGFTKGNGGPIGKKNKQEQAEEDNKENAEWVEEQAERISEQAQSQRELDQMDWDVDPYSQISFGGQTGNRIDWFKAARSARENLNKTAKENGWSDEKKLEQEQALARYMAALKKGDDKAAAEAWNKMDPKLQAEIKSNAKQNMAMAPNATLAERIQIKESNAKVTHSFTTSSDSGNLSTTFDANEFQRANFQNYIKALKNGDSEGQSVTWENMDKNVQKSISDFANENIESPPAERILNIEPNNQNEAAIQTSISPVKLFNEASNPETVKKNIEVAVKAPETTIVQDHKAEALALM